jgi:hypothetical protein
MKATKEYLRKRSIDFENDPRWQRLLDIVGNNTGYLLTYTKFVFEGQIPTSRIEQLQAELTTHRNILSTLPKQVVQYTDYRELASDLTFAIKRNAVNKYFQILTAEQKSLYSNYNEISKNDLANTNFGRDCVKYFNLPRDTRKIFERTIARHRTINNLREAFTAFVEFNTDPEYNFNAIVNGLINAPNAYIRHIDPVNQYIIARITKYPTMRKFGRGTSWCIADYADHFPNYARTNQQSTQTIIIDFNYPKSHRLHRVGVTFNREGLVSNMHVTGNSEIRPERYFNEATHINQEIFNHLGYRYNQGRYDAENLVDNIVERTNLSITSDELTQLIAFNGIDALIQQQQINTHKLCKVISDHTPQIETIFDELETDPDKAETAKVVKDNFVYGLFSRFNENNKFIDNFHSLVHWITPETAIKMKQRGFTFKYSKHIKAILDKYYFNNEVAVPETKTEVQTINGRRFKVTMTYESIDNKTLNPIVLAHLLENDSSQFGAKLYDQLITWAIRNNQTPVITALKKFHPEKSKIHLSNLEQYSENTGS